MSRSLKKVSLVRAALVGAVTLALSGCRLDLEVALDVDRDGAGRLAVALAADAPAQAAAAEADADPLALLTKAGAALRDEGWLAEDVTGPDGVREVTLSAGFDDPAALEVLATDLAQALSAPEVDLLDPLMLRLTEGTVEVSGMASAVPTAAVVDLGLTPEEAVRLVSERDAFGYTVRVRLPGEVLDSTATDVVGDEGDEARELVWDVPVGQTVAIRATSDRPTSPLVWVVAVSGVTTLAVALVLLVRRYVTGSVRRPVRRPVRQDESDRAGRPSRSG